MQTYSCNHVYKNTLCFINNTHAKYTHHIWNAHTSSFPIISTNDYELPARICPMLLILQIQVQIHVVTTMAY